MKSWMKVLLIAVPVAVAALPLGQVLWPAAQAAAEDEHAVATTLTGAQIGLFIVYSAIEAIFFGLGVAFLVLGLPLVRRLTGESNGLGWAVFASLSWLMLSWLPHGGMHRSMGDNIDLLLATEYIFHVSSMLCAAVIAYAFVRLLHRVSQGQAVPLTKKEAALRVQHDATQSFTP